MLNIFDYSFEFPSDWIEMFMPEVINYWYPDYAFADYVGYIVLGSV